MLQGLNQKKKVNVGECFHKVLLLMNDVFKCMLLHQRMGLSIETEVYRFISAPLYLVIYMCVFVHVTSVSMILNVLSLLKFAGCVPTPQHQFLPDSKRNCSLVCQSTKAVASQLVLSKDKMNHHCTKHHCFTVNVSLSIITYHYIKHQWIP